MRIQEGWESRLPEFVRAEFAGYLDCSILQRGFAHRLPFALRAPLAYETGLMSVSVATSIAVDDASILWTTESGSLATVAKP